MTLLADMRDRLAAALQIELRNRKLPAGSDIAYAVADRALEGVQFAALVGYVSGAEGYVPGLEEAGGEEGVPPEDLPDRQAAYMERRERLSADPIFSSLIP